MKRQTAPDAIIQAATGLLSPYYPEISATGLIDALEAGSSKDKKRLLSPKQYAELMGISVDTAKRLCKSGEVEWQRVGRQIRILVG